jgi:uncharacterized damage-inducible protein DinB
LGGLIQEIAVQQEIEAYVASFNDLRAAYDGMTREQLLAHPVEGKWSAMEVLCHLVDIELMIAMRIRAALQRDTPRLPASTIEELTANLAVDARDAEQELTCFETIRNQTARIVQSFPAEALDRNVVLVKVTGEEVARTVREFLTGMVGHVKHHLGFVIVKRRAMGIVERERGHSERKPRLIPAMLSLVSWAIRSPLEVRWAR